MSPLGNRRDAGRSAEPVIRSEWTGENGNGRPVACHPRRPATITLNADEYVQGEFQLRALTHCLPETALGGRRMNA